MHGGGPLANCLACGAQLSLETPLCQVLEVICRCQIPSKTRDDSATPYTPNLVSYHTRESNDLHCSPSLF